MISCYMVIISCLGSDQRDIFVFKVLWYRCHVKCNLFHVFCYYYYLLFFVIIVNFLLFLFYFLVTKEDLLTGRFTKRSTLIWQKKFNLQHHSQPILQKSVGNLSRILIILMTMDYLLLVIFFQY